MLRNSTNTRLYGAPLTIVRTSNENAVVAQFAGRINDMGQLSQASLAVQARILEAIKTVARSVNGSAEAGTPSRYDRRVLYEVPGRWSLAAIIFRPGQETELHDHGGWGCAVTVQGIERDRRFVHDASGNLVLSAQRDYPQGAGYVFSAVDVHQPVGADPRRLTIALHFLVHDSGHHNAKPESLYISNGRTKIAA
ncbi:MAG: 3-mercaptopropionate dioxygenase [Chloroflexia bacterium]|jgi:predicted metal-dependent enzyme (double-stranded beta helix superfamily)|nr:3-mercaptopropionate dioxygenase [Chloroflexia bacterium]